MEPNVESVPEIIFRRLSVSDARQIAGWQYGPDYCVYDTPADRREATVEYLLDLKNGFFGAYQRGALAGFCSIGPDRQVKGGSYDEPAMDLGAGMRPDLVGRGNEISFLQSVVAFAQSVAGPVDLRATIASWNKRALRTAEAAGFTYRSAFTDSAGRLFAILVLPGQTR